MGMKYWDALGTIRSMLALTRGPRDAAYAANDLASNAAANAAITGTAELWGYPIPITWGRRRIHGELLQIGPQSQKTVTTEFLVNPQFNSEIIPFTGGWQSNTGEKTETTFVSTFAYCFGQPGSKTARQILTKLWFNGQVIYDINAGQLSPEVQFKFYQGTEEQMPDDQLNGTRYEFPVAYRGMMYIVFYNYSIVGQATSGNPTVEAEFAEELTNNNPPVRYDTYGVNLGITLNENAIDPKKGVVYTTGNNGRFYKFDIATQKLIADYPASGVPAGGSAFDPQFLLIHAFARLSNVPYVFCTAAAANVRDLYMFNADTGAYVARYHPASGAFAPYAVNARASSYQGVGCIYLAVSGIGGNAFSLRCTPAEIVLLNKYVDPDVENALALPDGRMLYVTGAEIYLDGVLFYTAPEDVDQLFYSPVDDTVVLIASGGVFPWYIRKITLDPTPVVKWEINDSQYGPFTFPIGSAQFGPMSRSNLGNDQRVAWSNSSQSAILDLISGSFELVPRTAGAIGAHQTFDAFTNSIITTSTTGGASITAYPIFNQTSGNMLLSTFLRDVALLQGYESANITIEGISDQIIGACITEKTDIESMLEDIRKCYNFQIIKSGNKIRFSRRNYGSSLVVDASYTEDQRAILDSDDDVFVTVRTETSSPTQAAGTIILKYIDPAYNYAVTPFQYKRNDPAYDTSVTATFDLPIIMNQSDAAALAARALVDNNVAETTHDFRLPQQYLAHEPGDLIELVFDDYTDTVRAIEISYNADWSLSIKSEAIYTQLGPSYEVPDPVLPPEPPSLLSGQAMTLLMDTTLIRPTDQLDRDALETYVSAIPAGRLPLTGGSLINRSIDNGPPEAVTAIGEALTLAQLTSTMSPGPVWQVNYDEVITCRLVQGDDSDFHSDTLENMLAGSNRLLIGQAGRWEQVGYIDAAYDSATGLVTLTGIVRGWRGTELFAGLHAAGDYVIPVPEEDTVRLISYTPADLGKTVLYAASDSMLRLNYEDAQASVVLGLARRPWAPANVTVVNDAGDLDITWSRRTRLYGPLENGTGVVPLDEASEAYKLDIYRAGSVVRTLELTTPTFTYTNAMQIEDGWSAAITSIRLDVMQVSELVGPGFIKSGTYDVS